ncbi:hypothetical protein O1611_g9020 [Lasiodiplodia mahajangana]|uniref:Uncharacterized protein n=1 Tax=Lasiodiplodia mahajangana TaxID=1108764 RepID=A0ACC2JAY8_9PEZI|nr:hypothetical protein O1611_g9020 [Lasiodiplodia mahajangana]
MERAQQYSDSVWRNLNPLKAPPKMKHKSYYEAVENEDKKKKKLEFEVTTNREPPPGFEFIPTGHPELSQECKEQSRDRDAMFFIVSNSKDTLKLDHHMNRLGYHFRRSIVEAARKVLNEKGYREQAAYVHEPGKPEPIPNSQREIDKEADAVLRDLFPRIPNTDRQEIIDHAFKKDGTFNGEFKVGMAKDITLARRVQLAALAHIRHNHTRYDELLRESDWANARKAVEKPCLDIIVKWRGDEETGRDQLDEILREVIEISDSENESDEGNYADSARIPVPRTRSVAVSIPNRAVSRLSRAPNHHTSADSRTSSPAPARPNTPSRLRGLTTAERRTARKTQQRFKRYAAAAEALANSAGQNGQQEGTPGFVTTPMEVARRQGSARPVNPYPTTPSATAYETYIPRIPHGHAEIQRTSVPHSNSVGQNVMAEMPQISMDARIHGSGEQFIRVPDAQRPKVGPYSANYSHSRPLPPLSPVRLGLQDMLLPSIEPRSPDSPHILQNASQRMHYETQQSTEVPRVISRTIIEPAMPGSRPQSPGAMVNNGELVAKPRRVITYFPEDFQESSNSSYVRVAPRSQDDALRRPQYEYLADRRPLVPERVLYHDVSRAPPGQEVRVIRSGDDAMRPRAHPVPVSWDDRSMVSRATDHTTYQSNMRVPTHQEYPVSRVEAPLRSRANPIVIDGDKSYEPRRVAEVRGSPAHEIYRTGSPRGNRTRSPRPQRSPRIRDLSRVVYIDESTDRTRSESRNYHHIVPQPQLGQPAYQETRRPLSPNMSQQAPLSTFERSRRHDIPYDRTVARTNEPERIPLVRPGGASGGLQAPLLEAPGLERQDNYPTIKHTPGTRFADNRFRLATSQQLNHQLQHRVNITQEATQQHPRDNVIYREIRPDVSRPADVEYERGPQQPFPVYPAPSSYAEIRGPPTHRRIPDRRDMIYVE